MSAIFAANIFSYHFNRVLRAFKKNRPLIFADVDLVPKFFLCHN